MNTTTEKERQAELIRIAFRIQCMGDDLINEGLCGYGQTLKQYADRIEKVIW